MKLLSCSLSCGWCTGQLKEEKNDFGDPVFSHSHVEYPDRTSPPRRQARPRQLSERLTPSALRHPQPSPPTQVHVRGGQAPQAGKAASDGVADRGLAKKSLDEAPYHGRAGVWPSKPPKTGPALMGLTLTQGLSKPSPGDHMGACFETRPPPFASSLLKRCLVN